MLLDKIRSLPSLFFLTGGTQDFLPDSGVSFSCRYGRKIVLVSSVAKLSINVVALSIADIEQSESDLVSSNKDAVPPGVICL
jgi:hypothetical protein